MRTRLGMATIVVALALGWLIGPSTPSHAQLPSACVHVGIGSSTSTTVAYEVDTDGNSCPDPPPETGNPCDDPTLWDRDQRTTLEIYTDIYYCIFA